MIADYMKKDCRLECITKRGKEVKKINWVKAGKLAAVIFVATCLYLIANNLFGY